MVTSTHELLQAPLGCAVILLAMDRRLEPHGLSDPIVAYSLAAGAREALDPYTGFQREAIAEVLRRAQRFASYVEEVLQCPELSWWSAPLDRLRQVWLKFPTRAQCHNRPTVVTNTLVGGVTGQQIMLAHHIGESEADYPPPQARVHVSEDARVLEILTAKDWQELATTYRVQGARSGHDTASSPAGATFEEPAWLRVSDDFEGVRLTFMGLLCAWCVPVPSDIGTTMLRTWDSEQTRWLRPRFSNVYDLRPLRTDPPAPELPKLKLSAETGFYLRHS